MAATKELKCPYCGKSLSSEEHEHALEEFRLRVEEEHREQVDKEREQYRRQREGFEAEIKKLKERNQAELDSLSEKIRKESMDWCKEQIDCVKKMYNDLGIRRQREYERSLIQKTAELEQELYEKDRRFQHLQDDLQILRLQAIEEAKAAVQADIDRQVREKDIQLKRAEDDIDREG
jgi:DNA repair exonuclease SbcCD ATPase subunit